MSATLDTMPDGFISLEYELPLCDGWYELYAMVSREGKLRREIVDTYFDVKRGCFLPVRGVLYASGWREMMPDAADLEEFHERERRGCIWI